MNTQCYALRNFVIYISFVEASFERDYVIIKNGLRELKASLSNATFFFFFFSDQGIHFTFTNLKFDANILRQIKGKTSFDESTFFPNLK